MRKTIAAVKRRNIQPYSWLMNVEDNEARRTHARTARFPMTSKLRLNWNLSLLKVFSSCRQYTDVYIR